LGNAETTVSESDRPSRRQGTYWIATIPRASWEPTLPDSCHWIKGQLERGDSGYEHWQFTFALKNKGSLNSIRKIFPLNGHYELTVSKKASEYVWKDETSLGQRFEIGKLPLRRNSKTDWDEVRALAIAGDLESVPSDIFVRYYHSLRRISADYLRPVGIDKSVFLLWGKTGTGKSHRAWSAFPNAYAKDPRTKWWTGYRNEETVIIDEFRGGIDVAHILRWLDKYPVQVETKGGSTALSAKTIIITSNITTASWYPDLDPETFLALDRRIKIIEVVDQDQEINFI